MSGQNIQSDYANALGISEDEASLELEGMPITKDHRICKCGGFYYEHLKGELKLNADGSVKYCEFEDE